MTTSVQSGGGAVFIDGLQNESWGGGTNKNSVIATLAVALRVLKQDYSYAYLMGVSGAAFRLQISRPGICPSSPHAFCGFDCGGTVLESLPYRYEDLGPKNTEDQESVRQARAAVVSCIDRGEVVILASWENSLVVGYSENGKALLLRNYCANEPGYTTETVIGGGFVVPTPDPKELPSARNIYMAALTRARTLADADRFPVTPVAGETMFYAAGWNAYAGWIEDLTDEKEIAGYDKDRLSQFQLGNSHAYYCLLDARACAAIFCRKAAETLGGRAGEHLHEAAGLYEELTSIMAPPDLPFEVAPMAWMLKDGKVWDSAMRGVQIGILQKVREKDRSALAEIDAALVSG